MRFSIKQRLARRLPQKLRGDAGAVWAFTLLELLMVIAIIGIISGMALKTIGNLAKPKGMSSASRQVLDDLSYARSLALSSRSTVYFVMVPTNVYTFTNSLYSLQESNSLMDLIGYQYRGYALLQLRSIGEQPGQQHPHYLTGWRQLPDNVFFPPAAFDNQALNSGTFSRADFPFPNADSRPWTLHYIAFNAQGQLVYRNSVGDELATQGDAHVPLTEGSIFTLLNPDGSHQRVAADLLESEPGLHTNRVTRVTVNWVTGRSRIERLLRQANGTYLPEFQ